MVSNYSLEIGEVVQLDIYKGTKDREQDYANSGKWVIGRVERTFKNSEDKMTTKLTYIPILMVRRYRRIL